MVNRLYFRLSHPINYIPIIIFTQLTQLKIMNLPLMPLNAYFFKQVSKKNC